MEVPWAWAMARVLWRPVKEHVVTTLVSIYQVLREDLLLAFGKRDKALAC